MANDDETMEITPGTPEFAKMVFKLNDAVNDENLAVLNYNGGELTQIDDGVFAQPAYVNDDFNLFFLSSHNSSKKIGSLPFQRQQLKTILKSRI